MLRLSSLQWLSLLAAGYVAGWLCDCERTQPNMEGVVEGGFSLQLQVSDQWPRGRDGGAL